jgi:indolepyruvate ferredoxin oxidoreductase alpha subunit
LVLITADDPGMFSSQNEQDNRFYARFAQVPMLEPGDSQEAKDYIIKAYLISEQFDTPILVRLTTRLSHTRTPVFLGDSPLRPAQLPFKRNIPKYVMLPGYARNRHLVVEERRGRLQEYAETSELNEILWGDRSIGIISSGVVHHYAREALGDGASYLKLGCVYPPPLKLISEFGRQVDRLIVVEELEPFLEDQIKAAGLAVSGKDLFPRVGELNPELVERGVRGTSRFKSYFQVPDGLPARPPIMCAGCPHRSVFYVLHRRRAIVTGDIGCYTLGAMPPFEAIDACLCMGASIGASLGMEKAKGEDFARRVVAVIGDSTFVHSGITGLIDHVYNKSTGTIIILDNRTTAMTGHQDHPATGLTLSKQEAPKLDLVTLVRTLGVQYVRSVDPYDLDSLEQVIREEMDREELSVIISSRACVLINKEQPFKEMTHFERCTGCKKCLRLGCPALYLAEDLVSRDLDLCRSCSVCEQVCPQGKGVAEDD